MRLKLKLVKKKQYFTHINQERKRFGYFSGWTMFMFYLRTWLGSGLVSALIHPGIVVAWCNVFCEIVSVQRRAVNAVQLRDVNSCFCFFFPFNPNTVCIHQPVLPGPSTTVWRA